MMTALLLSNLAHASADLVVTMTPPVGNYVYDTARVNIAVGNIGNKSALATTLTIHLPKTGTTPTLVMGTLVGQDARCSLVGFDLVCALGTRTKGTTTTVWFDLNYPEVSVPVSVSATATTTSVQNSLLNDTDTETINPLNDIVTVLGGETANIDHCTGTNLTSYFECECFPSSIMSHEHIFNADHTLSVPVDPDASGTWSQPSPDKLIFDYRYGADIVATFVGYGVSANCFEGITTFPGSIYVSPYSVCLIQAP